MRFSGYWNLTNNLLLVLCALLALMSLTGCSPIGGLLKKEVPTSAFVGPEDVPERKSVALLWVQYRKSENWMKWEVPLAVVEMDGMKVGTVDTGQHGFLILPPGKVQLEVKFTSPIFGLSSSSVRTTQNLKAGSIQVISFGPPVTRMNVCTTDYKLGVSWCGDSISYTNGKVTWWVEEEIKPDLMSSEMTFMYRKDLRTR